MTALRLKVSDWMLIIPYLRRGEKSLFNISQSKYRSRAHGPNTSGGPLLSAVRGR
jgi:hypothetical protein